MQSIIRQTVFRNIFSSQTGNIVTRTMSSSVSDKYKYETVVVSSPSEFVYHVEMNRPDKLNAMNRAFWREIRECFEKIATDENCRAVVLSGKGRIFTAGLDIMDMAEFGGEIMNMDIGRKSFVTISKIKEYQEAFTVIEKCPKPVIAAIHNGCIGGGIDMTSACDIRYCTKDAFFQIKEVDLGLAADVGTLQRFPKITGNDSLSRELAYTARRMYAAEAIQCGFISRVFEDRESMLSGAMETAILIAEKSPIAVQGTKVNLIYSRDHSVPESLEYIAAWNGGMLQSADVMEAASSFMQKKKPTFSKL